MVSIGMTCPALSSQRFSGTRLCKLLPARPRCNEKEPPSDTFPASPAPGRCAAGADCVQFDDPMLGYFVDPKYREQRSGHWGTGQFSDVDSELRLGVASINRLAGPL